MDLLARTLRVIGSFVALVAIVGGLPAALVAWGHWPINGIPSWRQVENLPSTIVTDTALFGVLTVAVWVVWAAFCASVVVELVGNLRGEPGAQLPLCGPVQRWARPLVASLVMSVSATGSLSSASVGGSIAARPAAAVVAEHRPSPSTAPTAQAAAVVPSPRSAPPAPSQAEPGDRRAVMVRSDDTYWELAERELGDGLRWREIRDLNVGRQMPDGRVVGRDSDLLMPGWVLVLPDERPTSSPRAAHPADDARAARPTERGVQPGDSIWRIAEDHLAMSLGRVPDDREVADYCRVVIDHNRDRFVDPANPDLVYPGQLFVLPSVGTEPPVAAGPAAEESEQEPAPASSPERPPPLTEATTSPTTTPVTPSPAQPNAPATPATSGPADSLPPSTVPDHPAEPDQDDQAPLVAPVAAAGTALAVGLVAAIRRRRRRRNHLFPKSVPLPGKDEALHRELIVAADEDATDRLSVALDHLAHALADTDQVCRPVIVQHGPEHIDVLLDQPVTSPIEGWSLVDEGSLLTLDAAAVADEAPRRWSSPAPLLVSLGRPDGDGQICLDLEAVGVTTLVGDPVLRLDLMRSFAAEIAHSPLTETTQVYVVGQLGSDLLFDECEQVIVVDSWDDVLNSLAAWTTQSRSALSKACCPNGFVARTEDPDDDALVSLVVFATEPPPSSDSLDFVHAGPATTAVVVAYDVPLDGSTVVVCAPGEVWLPHLELRCIPEALDEDRAERVAALLREASDPAGTQLALALDVEPAGGGNGAVPDAEAVAPYEDPPYEVLVRLLGDVSVDGAKQRLLGQQLAVLAFIALRGTVTVDKAEDALWAAPTKVDTRRRLINIVSQCRTAVGDEHLPKANDGYYTVGPLVKTDIDLFEARAAAASQQQRWEDAADLKLSALSLCTGEVFHTKKEDSDSFAWIEASNLVSHWEIRITDLAEDLANDCLVHGDAHRAIKACEAGLRAMPSHTACTETLMRAHAHNGDLTSVQHVFQAHVSALGRIHLDHAAESTTTLYKQLMATT